MPIKYFLSFILITFIFFSCDIEFDCSDTAIYPVFIGIDSSDVDTLIVRKFKANNNYQNLIDTFIATPVNSSYNINNDSITVYIDAFKQENNIKVGYDWQIFIPSKQRIISFSDIKSEKTTGKRSRFLEPVNTGCTNRIFSVNVNGQPVSFTDSFPYVVFVHK